jgi:8-oxo-dGTP pyrophosphatase MutT (NUDIX family)
MNRTMRPTGAQPPVLEAMAAVEATIRGNLSPRPRRAAADGARRAAVTLAVFPHRGEPHLLIIKRSFAGRNAGQWALPGGRLEPGESAEEAALRELAEEAALVADPAEVAGVLDDLVTGSGFVITPYVVVIDRPVRPRRDPIEVHSLHPIPLRRLLMADLPRWRSQNGESLLQMPLRHDMVIHPPTGAILWQFREVALLGTEVGTADLVQPDWTHVV